MTTAAHLSSKKWVCEAVCDENVGLMDRWYGWGFKSWVYISETALLNANLPIGLGTFVVVDLISFLYFPCFNMLFCQHLEFSQRILCFLFTGWQAQWMWSDCECTPNASWKLLLCLTWMFSKLCHVYFSHTHCSFQYHYNVRLPFSTSLKRFGLEGT